MLNDKKMGSYRFRSIDFVCVVFKMCFLGCLGSEGVYTDLPLHLQNGKFYKSNHPKKDLAARAAVADRDLMKP